MGCRGVQGEGLYPAGSPAEVQGGACSAGAERVQKDVEQEVATVVATCKRRYESWVWVESASSDESFPVASAGTAPIYSGSEPQPLQLMPKTNSCLNV